MDLIRNQWMWGVAMLLMLAFAPSYADDYSAFEARLRGDMPKALEEVQSDRWRGVIQYESGDYEAAAKSFERAGDDAYNRATATAMSGDIDSAIEQYQSLLTDEPENDDARHNLEVLKTVDTMAGSGNEGGRNSKSSPNSPDQADPREQPAEAVGEKSEQDQQEDEDRQKVGERGLAPAVADSQGDSDQAGGESQDQSESLSEQEKEQIEQLAQAFKPEKSQEEEAIEEAQSQNEIQSSNFDEQLFEQWLQKLPEPGKEFLQRRVRIMHQRNYPQVQQWDGHGW